MTRPDDLVTLLRSGETGRPRLIWHAPGERIELSGRVLATWVSKAADLLQEDLDAEVGTRVRLVGAPHWRLLVWALATWTVGGVVEIDPAETGTVDVVVADAEEISGRVVDPADGAVVVAFTRAALARHSAVDLPAGVIDEAAVLLTHADEMQPYDRAADDDIALVDAEGRTTYGELVGPGTSDRRHVSGSGSVSEVLRSAVTAWASGGSIVLTDPSWERNAGDDPTSGTYADVLAQEGVTA